MAEERSLAWSDIFSHADLKNLDIFLTKADGKALLLGKDLVLPQSENNVVLLWYGKPSAGDLLKHQMFQTTAFSPDIPEPRDGHKTVAKGGKGTILRACYAQDTWDCRIFSDDLGEYIKRDEGKLQTNIILFDDHEAKVHTVNVNPKLYRPGHGLRERCQYVLDGIKGFKTKIILEEWDYKKCGGTYWHLRSESST